MIQLLLRSALIGTSFAAAALTEANAQDIIRALPGENVTLHTGYNVSGTVYVRILDTENGGPAKATFWSIKEFWNKDRGSHTGSASFKISGLRDELRAGGVDRPVTFVVTADLGVWQSISNKTVEQVCVQFELNCED